MYKYEEGEGIDRRGEDSNNLKGVGKRGWGREKEGIKNKLTAHCHVINHLDQSLPFSSHPPPLPSLLPTFSLYLSLSLSIRFL